MSKIKTILSTEFIKKEIACVFEATIKQVITFIYILVDCDAHPVVQFLSRLSGGLHKGVLCDTDPWWQLEG